MYLKLALGNVRRSVKDYSVFFATLAFAACLPYSFSSAGDYLWAMDLSGEQRGLAESQQLNTVMSAFSVFVVVVFAFLMSYGFRFIVRRRTREFALYGLLGMDGRGVSAILCLEGALVGVAAWAVGVAVGVLASPAFMLLEAWVFGVGWRPAVIFSPDAFRWTLLCFAALVATACAASGRQVARAPLATLFVADKKPERLLAMGKPRLAWAQLALGVVLVGAVWAAVLLQPALFLVLLVPFGAMALVGTWLVARFLAWAVPRALQRRPQRYLRGLTCFTVRQTQATASSSSMAMAVVCVLIACAVCMVAAGLAFTVGVRGSGSPVSAELADSLAPVGFIGLLYGLSFLLAAMAVLALQQLAEAADGTRRYRVLADLGASRSLAAGSLRTQVALYFGVPLAGALLHDVVGLTIVAVLAEGIGAVFGTIVAATVGVTVAVMVFYYVVTCRGCARIVLAPWGRPTGARTSEGRR